MYYCFGSIALLENTHWLSFTSTIVLKGFLRILVCLLHTLQMIINMQIIIEDQSITKTILKEVT